MDQMQKEAFAAAGVDIDSALERCLGNEVLLCRFYAKFLEDPNYAKLQTALAAPDPAGAVQAAHTLKGVCGNLSMTALFPLFARQVESLRAGDWDTADQLMEQISCAYGQVTKTIRQLLDHA